MATIVRGERRHKPGRWIVDYYDSFGQRRWKVCRTKEEAENTLAAVIQESRHRRAPTLDPNITVEQYSAGWLTRLAARTKPRTVDSARDTLRLRILPVFGTERVRRLDRGRIVDWLSKLLASGLSRNTVRLAHATLRSLLTDAVDLDGLLPSNPAAGAGKRLHLAASARGRAEAVKAMTREQLGACLEACRDHRDASARRLYPFWVLMARTGLRVGEALAVQWADINWRDRVLRVERAFSGSGQRRRLDTPKAGHGRDVDLSAQTVDILRRLEAKRTAETLRRGWGELPAWLFPNEVGAPMDDSKVRKIFGRILKAAGLPGHFTPHCLRHTFASLLLQAGESPAYVQRQLGHASIKLTVDLYGRWLPQTNKAAVDRLDDTAAAPLTSDAASAPAAMSGKTPRRPRRTVAVATGCQPVAAAAGGVTELRVLAGAGGGSRTRDLLITNQLLCL